MRKMKIAMMVCLTVAAVMLLGQSVWACSGVEKFTWYWCGPSQRLEDGIVWTADGVTYIRGRLFRNPLCMNAACSCEAIRDGSYSPDGYLFIDFSSDWTKPEGALDNKGPQWGDFWIGDSTEPSAIPLWQGTFTGNGDGYNNRYQRLVGSGLEENDGMKLDALCETIDMTKPAKENDHIINGYIQKPHGHGHW
jgi:hypothetical protein